MFGSAVLEVVIGISFVYFLLSLVCTALNEMLSQILGLRARNLEIGLMRILDDKRLRTAFYRHPLIRSLGRTRGKNEPVKPSYIPSQTFSMVMMDVVADQSGMQSSKDEKTGMHDPFGKWQLKVDRLEQKDMKKVLTGFMNASDGKVEKLRDHLETWFDDVMDRVSGTYKRKIQTILLVLALAISAAVNADTFEIASALWQYPALRQGVVKAAENYAEKTNQDPSVKVSLQQVNDQLKGLNIPIGWRPEKSLSGAQWLTKIIGLAFTALAVSLGAPFWFDLLNRFVRLRSSIKPPPRNFKPSVPTT
jgi:hypothetical protein